MSTEETVSMGLEGEQANAVDSQLNPTQEIEKLEQKNEKLTKENQELKRNNKDLKETADSRQLTNKNLMTQLNKTKKQYMVLEEQKKDLTNRNRMLGEERDDDPHGNRAKEEDNQNKENQAHIKKLRRKFNLSRKKVQPEEDKK